MSRWPSMVRGPDCKPERAESRPVVVGSPGRRGPPGRLIVPLALVVLRRARRLAGAGPHAARDLILEPLDVVRISTAGGVRGLGRAGAGRLLGAHVAAKRVHAQRTEERWLFTTTRRVRVTLRPSAPVIFSRSV